MAPYKYRLDPRKKWFSAQNRTISLHVDADFHAKLENLKSANNFDALNSFLVNLVMLGLPLAEREAEQRRRDKDAGGS